MFNFTLTPIIMTPIIILDRLALGIDRFKAEIEELTARRVTKGKRGRSVGWRKDKNGCDV